MGKILVTMKGNTKIEECKEEQYGRRSRMFLTNRITTVTHHILSEVIKEGDIVLDGTVGNGNDTLFLAKGVGNNGKVYGFDIQEQAIKKTKERLIENKVDKSVKLIHDSHDNIAKYITEELDIAVFNLGYLPGGDKSIVTKAKSTINAINQCLGLLKYKGLLSVTVYYGHEGGVAEKNAVESFVTHIDSRQYNVVKIDYINRPNNPPYLYLMERIRV